jgi:hypothetical protein
MGAMMQRNLEEITRVVAQFEDDHPLRKAYAVAEDDEPSTTQPHTPREFDMSTQDRYMDARLAGIESKLDARMDALERFQEQAEARRERHTTEAEARSGRAEARLEKAIESFKADNKTTRWTVIGTGIAVVSLIAAIMIGLLTAFQQTVGEQGAWLRQSVERIEAKIEAPAPAAAAREPSAE